MVSGQLSVVTGQRWQRRPSTPRQKPRIARMNTDVLSSVPISDIRGSDLEKIGGKGGSAAKESGNKLPQSKSGLSPRGAAWQAANRDSLTGSMAFLRRRP